MPDKSDFLNDLRNLKPAYPLVRLAWASTEAQDGECVVLEACPLTQLCLSKGLLIPAYLHNSASSLSDLVYGKIAAHYGEEALIAADRFVGEWDRVPIFRILPETIANVVNLVENYNG